jgi:5-methylthioadenosine/S-adenosylhomocysteine deaminase
MALVLSGRCVPCDANDPDAVFDGRIFVGDDGLVERITHGDATAPAGFSNAPVIDVGNNYIIPGLIDLHNHLGYNTLPLWTEPKQKTPFQHHDSWPRAASYGSSISLPANTLVLTEPEAFLAYVQLRAMVGGTTSIQGWPHANRKFVQVLRNIDEGPDRTGTTDLISTSTLTLNGADLAKQAQAQKNGRGFIYHCGEGSVNSLVRREFVQSSMAGCLRSNFIGIHCNSLTKDDWKLWSKENAGAVVWSPFSNLWLYGSTTDVLEARKQGVIVCLGSDWGPSGTKNVQGELKVAKLVNSRDGLGLKDRELFAMVTSNPGDALKRVWPKTIGSLAEGSCADITVMRPRGQTSAQNPVWTQLVDSREVDIALVVIEGVPRYGDTNLMQQGNTPSETFKLAGRDRRFFIPKPDGSNAPWALSAFRKLLQDVIADPVKAINKASAKIQAFAGPMDASDAPLMLTLDMPSGGPAFAATLKDLKKHADKIKVPPLASLLHDKAFFADIKGRGFHGGLLDGLKDFYP